MSLSDFLNQLVVLTDRYLTITNTFCIFLMLKFSQFDMYL